MIWLTIFFAFFLAILIILADMGKLRFLLWMMNAFPFGDKLVHFFFIGTLSFLVNRTALKLFPTHNSKWVTMIASFFLLVLFTLEEISQKPIANRDASFSDLVANYVGILFFAFIAWQTGKRTKNTVAEKPAG